MGFGRAVVLPRDPHVGGNAHRFFLAGRRQAGSVLQLEGQFGERERVLAKIGQLHAAGQVA